MTSTKSQNSNMLLAFLTLLGVIAIVAVVGFFMLRKGPEIIQGQAEVTEYRVSSKVPGRILEFRVNKHVLPKRQLRHKMKKQSKEHVRNRFRQLTKCGKKHKQALPLPRNLIKELRIYLNKG